MNIFVTDNDPVVSAINLCDQHARSKMIIESCIMLQNAFSQDSLSHESCPRTKTGRVRRRGKGYSKHQCTLWTIESQDNFEWLLEHALAMVDERNFRWPNSPEHFSVSFVKWCKENRYNTIIERKGLTPFAVAISQDSKCRQIKDFNKLSIVDQYRQYIINDKDFATWTKRKMPFWYGK